MQRHQESGQQGHRQPQEQERRAGGIDRAWSEHVQEGTPWPEVNGQYGQTQGPGEECHQAPRATFGSRPTKGRTASSPR